MTTDKEQFSTTILELPSKGLVYPTTSPLSKGRLEMRSMTASDEDVLTSTNLLKKGMALDYLLKSLIVDDIAYDDLVDGDKDAIMIAARINAYGSIYSTEINCPSCAEKIKQDIDLTSFEYKEIDPSIYQNKNEFDFTLPSTGKKITFKFLTHKDEKDIEKEMKFYADFNKKSNITGKPEKALSTRLKYIITSIDGERDRNKLSTIIGSLPVRDSFEFRKYYDKIKPGVNKTVVITCSECDREDTINTPIGVDFFWPRR